MLASSPPGIDVRAAEILAFHGFHDLGPARLESFLIDPNPYVRQVGWRITSRINIPLSRKIYEEGMQDKDLDVRREAMFAAGWNRNGWLLDYCRRLAASPSSEHYDAYLLLAVLGKADDLDLMCKLGSSKDLGAERLRLLGAFGHPAVIEPLIFFMRDGELRLMITAGEAFEKITGENILSLERVQLLPEDGHEPDEFEREFLDEAFLPDPNKAQAYWNKVKSPYHKGLRWCRGSDIGEGFNRETADLLDLESRWEAYFRAAFRGEVNESPLKLVS
jgi:HEAT repeat protein